MIWHPAKLEWRSKTLTGCESPSILQWYTALSVTSATVFREIHFQKVTSSVMVCAFILLFISMLKIWRVLAAGWSKGTGSSPKKCYEIHVFSFMRKEVQCFVFNAFVVMAYRSLSNLHNRKAPGSKTVFYFNIRTINKNSVIGCIYVLRRWEKIVFSAFLI